MRGVAVSLATVVASGALAVTSTLPARAATTAIDDTAADFQLGTTSSTYAADSNGGEVILAPAVGAEFDGPALPVGWTSTQWTVGSGASTVSGGQVAVDGTLLRTDAVYAAGHSLEFDATFSSTAPFQHVGLGLTLDDSSPYWAVFSTSDTGGELFTSVDNGALIPTTHTLGAGYLGSSHHFRIDWAADSVAFLVDGTPVNTEPVAGLSTQLAPVISDFLADSTAVTVDALRLIPYASSGTFTSRVHDAGGPADWGALSWTEDVPAATTLTLSVRTGNTATPDSSWSTFTPISSGGDVTTYGRYLQYRVTEATTNDAVTPALRSVSAAFTVDTTAPSVVSSLPGSGATSVAVSVHPSVSFSESVDPASATASTVALKAGSSVVAASVATSGSTVTLTPSAELTLGTVYTMTVSTGVTDLVGNALAAEQAWSFTTAYGTLTTAVPTITGTPAIGETLTADAGVWDPVPNDITYQWLRGATPISGATSAAYTVTAADAGATLSVTATGSKPNYATASRTSDPTVRIPNGTLTSATPTISGTAVIGQVLKADAGTWGPGSVTLGYQWLRGTAEIGTATTATYTVTAADARSTLSVRVTGSKPGYTTVSRTSSATATVPAVAAPNPTVSGVVRVGMSLTVVRGTWAPTPTRYTYQWYWLKASGARVVIRHATKPGYTPSGSVQGHRLQVRVKAYRGVALIATRYSGPTVKVTAGMTGRTPKISDTTPKVGQIVTAAPGTWKPARTTFSYQWYAKNRKGKVTRIAGATASTYQVEARYAGFRIKVKVTGAAPDYRSVAKASRYTHKITK